MNAQFLHAHSSRNQPQRYTLVFRDGQLLRHQDALTLVQYRSDARLAEVKPEVPSWRPLKWCKSPAPTPA
jgi:hypothetical protein